MVVFDIAIALQLSMVISYFNIICIAIEETITRYVMLVKEGILQ